MQTAALPTVPRAGSAFGLPAPNIFIKQELWITACSFCNTHCCSEHCWVGVCNKWPLCKHAWAAVRSGRKQGKSEHQRNSGHQAVLRTGGSRRALSHRARHSTHTMCAAPIYGKETLQKPWCHPARPHGHSVHPAAWDATGKAATSEPNAAAVLHMKDYSGY